MLESIKSGFSVSDHVERRLFEAADKVELDNLQVRFKKERVSPRFKVLGKD